MRTHTLPSFSTTRPYEGQRTWNFVVLICPPNGTAVLKRGVRVFHKINHCSFYDTCARRHARGLFSTFFFILNLRQNMSQQRYMSQMSHSRHHFHHWWWWRAANLPWNSFSIAVPLWAQINWNERHFVPKNGTAVLLIGLFLEFTLPDTSLYTIQGPFVNYVHIKMILMALFPA